jgi:cell fate (sporulation/competence/biofilm development) regulator YlbF (YheA/YmcA/DUF963 family)
MSTMSLLKRLLLLNLLPLLVVGCVDLSAVKRFAALSSSVTDNHRVVEDYVESPKRQRLYQPVSQHAALDAIAARRAKQQAQFTAVQSTLVGYMKALQDLASDEAISLDHDIDGLKTALENSKFIGEADQASNKETATAAATIVKILSTPGLDQWRKSEVKQLIRETNPAVQQAISGFVGILNVDLRQSLVNEQTAITKPFDGWKASSIDLCVKAEKMKESLEKKDPPTPAAELRKDCQRDAEPMAVEVLSQEHLAAFSNKEPALNAYIESLQTIATGHQYLYDHLDEIDKKIVVGELQRYSKTIQTLRKAIITLSK